MRRAGLWLPPIVYMMAIFAVSSQSQPLPGVTRLVWDKALHLVEYGGLAVLFYRAFAGEGFAGAGALTLAVIATSLYGASDEWHQAFVPMRESSIHDWYADVIGAALGSVISKVLRPRRPLPR